jgi:hypothetical protein
MAARRWWRVVLGCSAVALLVLGLVAAARLAPQPLVRSIAIPELRGYGLSGVARDAGGVFWAVSEERRELHALDARWDGTSRRRLPISGVAAELELESAAFLGDGRFAIGTETEAERDSDAILVVGVEADRAVVTATWTLPWRALHGAPVPPNRGVEGLCAGNGWVVAALEATDDSGSARIARMARARHRGVEIGEWEPLRLRLTSTTGKISALECGDGGNGRLVAHAVERHYGVTRILRFEVPAEGTPGGEAIVPEVVFDVSAAAPGLPNVEGIALDGARVLLLSDHDPDDAEGSTELLHLVVGVRPVAATIRGVARLGDWW